MCPSNSVHRNTTSWSFKVLQSSSSAQRLKIVRVSAMFSPLHNPMYHQPSVHSNIWLPFYFSTSRYLAIPTAANLAFHPVSYSCQVLYSPSPPKTPLSSKLRSSSSQSQPSSSNPWFSPDSKSVTQYSPGCQGTCARWYLNTAPNALVCVPSYFRRVFRRCIERRTTLSIFYIFSFLSHKCVYRLDSEAFFADIWDGESLGVLQTPSCF
jgi:hypothetical protein